MIRMKLETSSANKFIANLRKKQLSTTQAGKEAIHEAAKLVYDDSQAYVPFVTGTLWASATIVNDDSENVGRSIIGYGDNTVNPTTGKSTASYAVDAEEEHKFLENALLNNSTQVGEYLRNRIMQEFQK